MKKTQNEMTTSTKSNKNELVQKWSKVSKRIKYKQAAVSNSCARTTMLMEEELFDGILLNLSFRNSMKSYSAQKRILRRIVEKRQAKSVRRHIKRTENRFTNHLVRYCAGKSMKDLRLFQLCA